MTLTRVIIKKDLENARFRVPSTEEMNPKWKALK